MSPGRDQVFGDGSYKLPENLTHPREGKEIDAEGEWVSTEVQNMETVLVAIQNENDTRDQITNKIYELTVDSAGSDDLVVGEEFLIRKESGTRVTGIYPEQYDPEGIHIHRIEINETMVVEGVTNRSPKNSITVDLVHRNGNYVGSIDPVVIDDWGADGNWKCEIPLSAGVEPGKYEVRVSDGKIVIPILVDILAEGWREDESIGGESIEIKKVTQTVTRDSGAIVFVEGNSDKGVFEELSKVIARNDTSRTSVEESNVTLRPIGGSNMKRHGGELHETLSHHRTPHLFITDSDDENPDQKKKTYREEYLNSAPVYVLNKYCIEAYLLESPRAIAESFNLEVNEVKDFINDSKGRPNKKEVMKDLFQSLAGRSYDEKEHGWTIARNFRIDEIPDEIDELINRMENLPGE